MAATECAAEFQDRIMRIYHYTNLESLALILKNKTIRFNRLDRVDDYEEGNAESLGVRFSKYVFASCWTEEPEESIPLWKMYGGDFGGLRISMEHEMFKEYNLFAPDLHIQTDTGFFSSKIPAKDMNNPDFFIFPFLDYENDLFYRQIRYVDNVFEYTKDSIKIGNINGNRGDMNLEMKSFGYYKNKRWEFQKESRFVLYIFPVNILREGANPEISSIVMQRLLNNIPLPFSYYDMNLKEDAMDNMEITLSPSASEAQKIIVQTLVDKYAPRAKVFESSLGKLVRL
ncbi:MAG: hypothetical protein PHR19_07705 [Bacteroidales bacterium]|nr:hypothetical protein [Bacteroidales bacterium]